MVISQVCFCVSLVAHGSRRSDDFFVKVLFCFILFYCAAVHEEKNVEMSISKRKV